MSSISRAQRTLSCTILACVVGYCAAGCEAIQLDHRTCRMSSTLSDLQYREVMDNLARMAACPNSLPYFNVATTGHTSIQQQGQATAGLGWGLVTAAPTGFTQLFGKTLLNTETFGLQFNQQDIDTWDTVPSLDPIQLLAMQGLYHKALGLPMSPIQVRVLDQFYARSNPACARDPLLTTRCRDRIGAKATVAKFQPTKEYLAILWEMYDDLGPGWLHVTPKKCVPQDVCYVAFAPDTYVWVTGKGMEQLTNLTLLIIDAATRDTSQEVGGTRTNQSRLQFPNPSPAPALRPSIAYP